MGKLVDRNKHFFGLSTNSLTYWNGLPITADCDQDERLFLLSGQYVTFHSHGIRLRLWSQTQSGLCSQSLFNSITGRCFGICSHWISSWKI